MVTYIPFSYTYVVGTGKRKCNTSFIRNLLKLSAPRTGEGATIFSSIEVVHSTVDSVRG